MSFCRYHTCKDKQFLLIQQEKHDIYSPIGDYIGLTP